MGYVIVTDSVLDIEERFLHQNGICTVPLSFTIDGYDTVEDDFGKTVPFSDFYRQLRDGAAVTTAQAPISAFTSVFEVQTRCRVLGLFVRTERKLSDRLYRQK